MLCHNGTIHRQGIFLVSSLKSLVWHFVKWTETMLQQPPNILYRSHVTKLIKHDERLEKRKRETQSEAEGVRQREQSCLTWPTSNPLCSLWNSRDGRARHNPQEVAGRLVTASGYQIETPTDFYGVSSALEAWPSAFYLLLNGQRLKRLQLT